MSRKKRQLAARNYSPRPSGPRDVDARYLDGIYAEVAKLKSEYGPAQQAVFDEALAMARKLDRGYEHQYGKQPYGYTKWSQRDNLIELVRQAVNEAIRRILAGQRARA